MQKILHPALILIPALLVLALPAAAQTTALYGIGCPGSGMGPAIGHSLNGSGGPLSNQTLPNEYGYPVKAPANLVVLGVQYYCKSVSTPTVTGIAFYREDTTTTGQPAATALASGEMPTGTGLTWYTGLFDQPMVVKSGELFWVSQLETNLVNPADLTAGTAPPGTIYWRRTGVSWTKTGSLNYPAYKIIIGLYGTGPGTPLLSYRGLPALGQSLDVNLNFALAPVPATLFLGLSDSSWAKLPLPFDLTPLGAKGCLLYCSSLLNFTQTTNRSGGATVQIGIPKDPVLTGARLFNQWLVVDPKANALKLVTTNGGSFTIG